MKKTIKVTLLLRVNDNFYLPAFTGSIEGWMSSVKVLGAGMEEKRGETPMTKRRKEKDER